MKHSVSDSCLMDWWRKCVRAIFNNTCAFYDPQSECDNILECHHIVKRRVWITRWDWRNGILVCQQHHGFADSKRGELQVVSKIGTDQYEYIIDRERILKKDWLFEHAMTDNEFRIKMLEELKLKYIEEIEI